MRLLCALVFSTSLSAFPFELKQGQVVRRGSGGQYTLLKRLGGGAFGDVWEASDNRGGHVALKFYRNELGTERVLRVQDYVSKRMSLGDTTTHLLNVGTEAVTVDRDFGYVVTSELAGRSVYDEMPTEYTISPGMPVAEQARRITNTEHMMTDVLEGLRELHRMGFVHYDPNPKNVLRFGISNKLGDLDEVSRIGTEPPEFSAEVTFAAMEQGNTTMGHLGPLADLSSVGNLTFCALFGRTPLELFAETYMPLYRREPARALLIARRRLWIDANARRLYYGLIDQKLGEVSESSGLPYAAIEKARDIKKFIRASLRIDPQERFESLVPIRSHLAEDLSQGMARAGQATVCNMSGFLYAIHHSIR
jgi:serine/threonine protein kinase